MTTHVIPENVKVWLFIIAVALFVGGVFYTAATRSPPSQSAVQESQPISQTTPQPKPSTAPWPEERKKEFETLILSHPCLRHPPTLLGGRWCEDDPAARSEWRIYQQRWDTPAPSHGYDLTPIK